MESDSVRVGPLPAALAASDMAGSSVSNREFIRLDAFVVAQLQVGLSFPPSGSKEVRAPRSIFSVNSDDITPRACHTCTLYPCVFLLLRKTGSNRDVYSINISTITVLNTIWNR